MGYYRSLTSMVTMLEARRTALTHTTTRAHSAVQNPETLMLKLTCVMLLFRWLQLL